MIVAIGSPRPKPQWPARDVLLHFVRSHAPDLRIRKQRLDDGRRACAARFTFRGEDLAVETVLADTDPLDSMEAALRRCAWILWRRLGLAASLYDLRRERLEQEILAASLVGDVEGAQRLGLELVLLAERSPATATKKEGLP